MKKKTEPVREPEKLFFLITLIEACSGRQNAHGDVTTSKYFDSVDIHDYFYSKQITVVVPKKNGARYLLVLNDKAAQHSTCELVVLYDDLCRKIDIGYIMLRSGDLESGENLSFIIRGHKIAQWELTCLPAKPAVLRTYKRVLAESGTHSLPEDEEDPEPRPVGSGRVTKAKK